MRGLFLGIIAVVSLHSGAIAQNQRTTVTASNGVEVSIVSDSFAGRSEFTAPSVRVGDFSTAVGNLLVAAIKEGGQTRHFVTGFVIYGGSGWHFYERAIFRGGTEANFTAGGRDVGRCTRYGGCSHTEEFEIRITPEEIARHAEQGILPIQLRGRSGNTILFEVPVSYFEAVREVASR